MSNPLNDRSVQGFFWYFFIQKFIWERSKNPKLSHPIQLLYDLCTHKVRRKNTMTPEEYMQIAIEEAKKGSGFTSPNPLVGAVLVKDGKKCHFKLQRRLSGSIPLCHMRAVLSLRENTSLHTDHHRKRNRKSIYRFLWSESKSQWRRHQAVKRCGNRSSYGSLKGRVWCTQSGIFSLHRKKRTLRRFKICDDGRWKNCDKNRSLKMDYRRSGEKTCAVQPKNLQWDHGGNRNRVSRWPDADLSLRKCKKSGQDHMRQQS